VLDPREEARCELRTVVDRRDERIQFGVGEVGEGGHYGVKFGVHGAIVQQSPASVRLVLRLATPSSNGTRNSGQRFDVCRPLNAVIWNRNAGPQRDAESVIGVTVRLPASDDRGVGKFYICRFELQLLFEQPDESPH
jgi:hypothetical protein